MFTRNLPTVSNCPHTKTKGIIRMTPQIISALAGAVYDKDEWGIILEGRWTNYEIFAESYFIPPQERGSVRFTVDRLPFNPSAVTVVHSHHSMTARFSPTDEYELNTRFRSSIVISQNSRSYLGFDYEAMGKVTLPCGAMGKVPFYIQPTEGPEIATIDLEPKGTQIGDCCNYHTDLIDKYTGDFHTMCGITSHDRLARAFGQSDTLRKRVEKIPRTIRKYQKFFQKDSWDAGDEYDLMLIEAHQNNQHDDYINVDCNACIPK